MKSVLSSLTQSWEGVNPENLATPSSQHVSICKYTRLFDVELDLSFAKIFVSIKADK